MHVLEHTGSSPSLLVFPLWLLFLFKIGSGDTVGHLGVITRIGGWIFRVTGVADTSLLGNVEFHWLVFWMWGSWGTFELRVVTVNCSLDSPRRSLRSLRHSPYLWTVLGKSALHMTHPVVSPSLMFSMVQWGLYHMAKLVATQSCFVHS